MLERCRLFWPELKVDEVAVMVPKQPLTSRPFLPEICTSMSVDRDLPATLLLADITVEERQALVTVMKDQVEEQQTLEPAHY
jgi:hypothetical protein